jgi:hypothetical protein
MKAGIWPPLLLGAGIIAVWEIYVRAAGIDPLLLPPPSAVAKYLVENAGIFARNGAATLLELLVGFASGVIIGLSLGILMQVWHWFREAAYPWLVATQMVPIPAVAPIPEISGDVAVPRLPGPGLGESAPGEPAPAEPAAGGTPLPGALSEPGASEPAGTDVAAGQGGSQGRAGKDGASGETGG